MPVPAAADGSIGTPPAKAAGAAVARGRISSCRAPPGTTSIRSMPSTAPWAMGPLAAAQPRALVPNALFLLLQPRRRVSLTQHNWTAPAAHSRAAHPSARPRDKIRSTPSAEARTDTPARRLQIACGGQGRQKSGRRRHARGSDARREQEPLVPLVGDAHVFFLL